MVRHGTHVDGRPTVHAETWWIKSARTAATRDARIATVIERAAENRMANHPAGRDRVPRPQEAAG
ncbi:MAG: YdeI/OmpD-associated family protein [Kineosporiaceae bacterium]